DVGSDDPVFQDDDTEFGENTRAPRRSDEEKAIAVLQFMKQTLGRFSLRLLFQTLLTSDNGAITNSTNMYFQSGGAKHLLELGVGDRWKRDKELAGCIISKAAEICDRETGWLTDQVSKGPNYSDAEFLRVKATDI
ncbi:hypothetical protein C8R47DRAFT_939701, partial [Mycena vitilis]